MSVRRGRDGREIVEELKPPSCQVPSCARVPHRLVSVSLACEGARQASSGWGPASLRCGAGKKVVGVEAQCCRLRCAPARVACIPQRRGWSAQRALTGLRCGLWRLAATARKRLQALRCRCRQELAQVSRALCFGADSNLSVCVPARTVCCCAAQPMERRARVREKWGVSQHAGAFLLRGRISSGQELKQTACVCLWRDREGSVQPVMDKIIGKRVFRIVGENARQQCASVR